MLPEGKKTTPLPDAEEKKVTRREFIKEAAVVAGGMAVAGGLAACAPAVPQVVKETVVVKETIPPITVKETVLVQAPTSTPAPTAAPVVVTATPVPRKWDYEVDVVVVGFGGAGAATAITATDKGAKVLILEKAPEAEEGGNTSVCGGEAYSHQNIQSAIQYLTAMNGLFPLDKDLVEVWANKMADSLSFRESRTPALGSLVSNLTVAGATTSGIYTKPPSPRGKLRSGTNHLARN
jgi:hypothetical protein